MKHKRIKPLRKHHVTPRTRLPDFCDKDKNNIVMLPEDFHAFWHYVFGVLTPDEAKSFVDIVMRPGTSWTHRDLNELRALIMQGYREEAA